MPACSGVDLWAIGCTFADILSPSDHALFPGGSDLEQLCLIFQAGIWLCLQFGKLVLRVLITVCVQNGHEKALTKGYLRCNKLCISLERQGTFFLCRSVKFTFCAWAVKISSAMRRLVHLMKMTGQKFESCQTIRKSPLQRGRRHLSS